MAGAFPLREETRAGHGGGTPVSKRIGEYADIYGFVMHQMGMAVNDVTTSGKDRKTGVGSR